MAVTASAIRKAAPDARTSGANTVPMAMRPRMRGSGSNPANASGQASMTSTTTLHPHSRLKSVAVRDVESGGELTITTSGLASRPDDTSSIARAASPSAYARWLRMRAKETLERYGGVATRRISTPSGLRHADGNGSPEGETRSAWRTWLNDDVHQTTSWPRSAKADDRSE